MLLSFTAFTGCADAAPDSSVADRTYLYEKEGFGGDFIIEIKGDGDDLIFIAEDSSNFMHLTVLDGERFSAG